MNYFDQLKRAAQIFRRTRALWWLGILAALFGQSEFGVNVNYSGRMPAGQQAQPSAAFESLRANPLIAAFLANPVPYLLALGAALLIWWVIATLVGWLAQAAMIQIAAQADQGAAPAAGAALRQSRGRIWPLFLIQLVLAAPALMVVGLALALLAPPILAMAGGGTPDMAALAPRLFGAVLCLVPLFLLSALAGVVLRLLGILAARACVLEQLAVRDSLRRGWSILRHNLGYTLLNWFVLLILGALLGVVAALPALLLIIPVGQAIFTNSWTSLTTAAAIAGGAYLLVIGLGAGGIYTGFVSTVWTVLFQSFQQRADTSPTG